jgi:hypothetical protein
VENWVGGEDVGDVGKGRSIRSLLFIAERVHENAILAPCTVT